MSLSAMPFLGIVGRIVMSFKMSYLGSGKNADSLELDTNKLL